MSIVLVIFTLIVSRFIFAENDNQGESRFNSTTLVVKLFVATILVLIYQIIIYRINPCWLQDFKLNTIWAENEGLKAIILITIFCLVLVWTWLKIFKNEFLKIIAKIITRFLTMKMGLNWYEAIISRQIFFWPVYILITLLGLSSFMLFGTNRTFDILLAFVLVIRWLIYGLGIDRIFILNILNNGKDYINDGINKVFKFSAILIPMLMILGCTPKEVTQSVEDKPEREVLSKGILKWFEENEDDKNKVVLIVNGQGGGSKAGCTFFTTLAKINEAIPKPKILNITTISGSSNGAGFYLGMKKFGNLPKGNSILSAAKKLYQHDYISPAFLFFDHYF